MTDLKKAILDAKYIDMIALGDFVSKAAVTVHDASIANNPRKRRSNAW